MTWWERVWEWLTFDDAFPCFGLGYTCHYKRIEPSLFYYLSINVWFVVCRQALEIPLWIVTPGVFQRNIWLPKCLVLIQNCVRNCKHLHETFVWILQGYYSIIIRDPDITRGYPGPIQSLLRPEQGATQQIPSQCSAELHDYYKRDEIVHCATKTIWSHTHMYKNWHFYLCSIFRFWLSQMPHSCWALLGKNLSPLDVKNTFNFYPLFFPHKSNKC